MQVLKKLKEELWILQTHIGTATNFQVNCSAHAFFEQLEIMLQKWIFAHIHATDFRVNVLCLCVVSENIKRHEKTVDFACTHVHSNGFQCHFCACPSPKKKTSNFGFSKDTLCEILKKVASSAVSRRSEEDVQKKQKCTTRKKCGCTTARKQLHNS